MRHLSHWAATRLRRMTLVLPAGMTVSRGTTDAMLLFSRGIGGRSFVVTQAGRRGTEIPQSLSAPKVGYCRYKAGSTARIVRYHSISRSSGRGT